MGDFRSLRLTRRPFRSSLECRRTVGRHDFAREARREGEGGTRGQTEKIQCKTTERQFMILLWKLEGDIA